MPSLECFHITKEPHFFADCNDTYQYGMRYYEHVIGAQDASPDIHVRGPRGVSALSNHSHTTSSYGQVIDATPSYMCDPRALPRIKLAYGTQPLKIIVLLRDPVDR